MNSAVSASGQLGPLRRLKKAGIRTAAVILPPVYHAYMWLVAATSKIHRADIDAVFDRANVDVNVALATLHQDVFVAPFLFRDRAILTLASVGDAGDVITAMLERFGFQVVRGGTSSRGSRRTTGVVRDMIERARDTPPGRGMITAFTPDGSRGPAGAVRGGVALLAVQLDAELYCMKTHASRALYLNTWDRTMIPLPFGEIRVYVDGPLQLPEPGVRGGLEQLRAATETGLHALHRRAFELDGRRPVPALEPLHGPKATTS